MGIVKNGFMNNLFVIDSNSLETVQTHLYGYCFFKNCLIENKDLSQIEAFAPQGIGAYVYVERKEDIISVYQDYIGSYGLYLFKNEEYFALSNSFHLLIDHIKGQYAISLNRDYANCFIVSGLCSVAYSETMVNEIESLSKDAVVQIDVRTGRMDISYLHYGENTVPLDSQEGINILDRWYSRWTNIIRNISDQTPNISADLSGGFDSRMVFMLLNAGGVLKKIRIKSLHDKLHTHVEDYEIASEIAEYYDFSLNKSLPDMAQKSAFSLEEIVAGSFYAKLCFHKQLWYKNGYFLKRLYSITGGGGECVRSYWNMTPQEFLQKHMKAAEKYPIETQKDMCASIEKIISSAFDKIREKYNISDKNSKEITLNLYRETRCRNHFGKDEVESYLCNDIKILPLMDPDLQKLKLNDDNCEDKNLLMALMYTRYCPKLLDFKFEGNRSIEAETIHYAKIINQKYSEYQPTGSDTNRLYKLDEECIYENCSQRISSAQIEAYIYKIFQSKELRKTFSTFFDEDIYRETIKDIEKKNYQPLQSAYVIIGITKIINDVITSRNLKYDSMVGYMDDLYRTSDDKQDVTEVLLAYAEEHMNARIDLKNEGQEGNRIQIVSLSSQGAKAKQPEWLEKNGSGYVVEDCSGKLKLKVQCIKSGIFMINLRGKDVRNEDNVKIPKWITYKKMVVNGKPIFEGEKSVWHDKPYRFSCACEDGEILDVELEWEAYKEIRNTNLEPLLNFAKEKMMARIDLKNQSSAGGDFEIISVSDSEARITTPDWFGKNGRGYVVESYVGKMDITLRCLYDGEFAAALRGPHMLNEEKEAIPKWVDYKKFIVNGETVFEETKPVWHNKPVRYSCPCRAGEIITIYVEWEPHTSLETEIAKEDSAQVKTLTLGGKIRKLLVK